MIEYNLTGKVAVVTGVSRGIGQVIARTFANHGATVIGCSRSAPSSVSLPKVYYVATDVGSETDIDNFSELVAKKWGRVDILVNNAGLLGQMNSLVEYQVQDWDDVINSNLRGPFLMTRALVPLMHDGASIINVSSGYGVNGRAFAGAYGVSKFAIEGYSQILAEELLSARIRVNVIDPGAVRTDMRAMVSPTEDPLSIPAPEEIMPVFLFLASDDSRNITGQRFQAQKFISKGEW